MRDAAAPAASGDGCEGCRLSAAARASAHQDPGPVRGHGIGCLLVALRDVLAQRRAAEARDVALRDLVVAMGPNSFPVLVLLFALLLVSPLSALPGATTLFGLSIAAILAQWLLGRDRVRLPGLVLDRQLTLDRTEAALRWLDRPVGWLDLRLRQRQGWVFAPAVAPGPIALVLLASACAPVMEVIPGSGTTVGAAIVLFSAGLLARDGVFVLMGASLAAALPASLWLLVT